MLLIKKHTKKNKNCMIQFLKTFEYDESDDFDTFTKIDSVKYAICYFYLYLKKYLRINLIKNYTMMLHIDTKNIDTIDTPTYQIIKDSFTETWFFTCDKLVVLYIDKNEIADFYSKYISSHIYKFIIYKDSGNYVVFCISHTSDQIRDYLGFLVHNYYEPKYLLFSCFLNPNALRDTSNDHISNQYLDYDTKMILNTSTPVGFVILNNNYKYNIKENYIPKTKRMEYYTTLGGGKENIILVNLVKIALKIVNESKYLPVNYFI
jgi:hypothetical protein